MMFQYEKCKNIYIIFYRRCRCLLSQFRSYRRKNSALCNSAVKHGREQLEMAVVFLQCGQRVAQFQYEALDQRHQLGRATNEVKWCKFDHS
jgi:hypothetical protein